MSDNSELIKEVKEYWTYPLTGEWDDEDGTYMVRRLTEALEAAETTIAKLRAGKSS